MRLNSSHWGSVRQHVQKIDFPSGDYATSLEIFIFASLSLSFYFDEMHFGEKDKNSKNAAI